jgi:septal ring factor EnvC (AmiA/AmiB activator)
MRLIEHLNSELVSKDQSSELKLRLLELEELNSALEAKRLEMEESLNSANAELKSINQSNSIISNELSLMQQSISWRITNPMRRLKAWTQK